MLPDCTPCEERVGRRYVLVTPARNEARYLAATIESVLAQRQQPERWVIVDDGSDDATGAVARRYAGRAGFLRVLRRPGEPADGFASKVRAFEAGRAELRDVGFDFIGNLDADVTFGPDFFRLLIDKFLKNPRLGIGGGWIYERQLGNFRPRYGNRTEDVAGAAQLFRRECFEAIGGYPELRFGGEDSAAQAAARLYGWQVASFRPLCVNHHKTPGRKLAAGCRQQFREGIRDRALGYHPLYLALKCARRTVAWPPLAGSACRLGGYVWALARGVKPGLDSQVVAFIRREQLGRIRAMRGLA
jgi:glycosyltransferase involved in cell wall biosynthesis